MLFRSIRGSYQLGKPNLYSIAKSVEKIQGDLHHVVTGFKRIKVDNYNANDREEEAREREEWMREAAKKLGSRNK